MATRSDAREALKAARLVEKWLKPVEALKRELEEVGGIEKLIETRRGELAGLERELGDARKTLSADDRKVEVMFSHASREAALIVERAEAEAKQIRDIARERLGKLNQEIAIKQARLAAIGHGDDGIVVAFMGDRKQA